MSAPCGFARSGLPVGSHRHISRRCSGSTEPLCDYAPLHASVDALMRSSRTPSPTMSVKLESQCGASEWIALRRRAKRRWSRSLKGARDFRRSFCRHSQTNSLPGERPVIEGDRHRKNHDQPGLRRSWPSRFVGAGGLLFQSDRFHPHGYSQSAPAARGRRQSVSRT